MCCRGGEAPASLIPLATKNAQIWGFFPHAMDRSQMELMEGGRLRLEQGWGCSWGFVLGLSHAACPAGDPSGAGTAWWPQGGQCWPLSPLPAMNLMDLQRTKRAAPSPSSGSNPSPSAPPGWLCHSSAGSAQGQQGIYGQSSPPCWGPWWPLGRGNTGTEKKDRQGKACGAGGGVGEDEDGGSVQVLGSLEALGMLCCVLEGTSRGVKYPRKQELREQRRWGRAECKSQLTRPTPPPKKSPCPHQANTAATLVTSELCL